MILGTRVPCLVHSPSQSQGIYSQGEHCPSALLAATTSCSKLKKSVILACLMTKRIQFFAARENDEREGHSVSAKRLASTALHTSCKRSAVRQSLASEYAHNQGGRTAFLCFRDSKIGLFFFRDSKILATVKLLI